jgi:hypothetical protein
MHEASWEALGGLDLESLEVVQDALVIQLGFCKDLLLDYQKASQLYKQVTRALPRLPCCGPFILENGMMLPSPCL